MRGVRAAVLLALWLPLAAASVARGGEAAYEPAVGKAIDAGRKVLWSQWKDGHWPEVGKPGKVGVTGEDSNYGGRTALCAYALLACGEKPDEPRVKQTLEWLAACDMVGVYARSMRVNAFALLGKKAPQFAKLKEDVDFLISAIDSRGRYDYTAPAKPPADRAKFLYERYDNSVSQLAVLGVWVGANLGIDVPNAYWRLVESHWKEDQASDGGWGYQKDGKAYGSMTAAGVATMYLCFGNNYVRDFIECRSNTDFAPMVKGMDWLDRNFSAVGNPNHFSYYYYYLYGVQRVGQAGGHKYFGKTDWYEQCAKVVLDRQVDGAWGDTVDTSFALLFLARGQGAVLFNKLHYGGTWNCRPSDLANLTRWLSRTFETQIHWQNVNLKVPAVEWHDAPILYISGASAPDFEEADLAKFREFVLQGGTILSEAAGSREQFTLAMKRFYAKAFPGQELKELDKDHPLYNVHYKLKEPTGLTAIGNGVRLLAIHSPKELSLAWQLNDEARQEDVFNLAGNIYCYVTDSGAVPSRGVIRWPAAEEFTPVAKAKVAPLKYQGNFCPEPLAWKRFAILMGNRERVAVDVAEPAAIADVDPAKSPLAAMTGTGTLRLTDEELASLKKYLTGGGTLVVDAAGGNAEFGDSAEKLLSGLLEGGIYDMIPAGHPLYVVGDWKVGKVEYRKALRGANIEPGKPRLRGVTWQGRLAIIIGKDDLTAGLMGYPLHGLRGYEPESAFELMRNIVLYAGVAKPGK